MGEAVLLTFVVIAGNTILRPLVNAINRIPIDERRTEATYEISVTTPPDKLVAARDLLVERLEAAHYPVQEVEVHERGEEMLEIVATLVSTAIEPGEIEAVIRELANSPQISHASWQVRTSD